MFCKKVTLKLKLYSKGRQITNLRLNYGREDYSDIPTRQNMFTSMGRVTDSDLTLSNLELLFVAHIFFV